MLVYYTFLYRINVISNMPCFSERVAKRINPLPAKLFYLSFHLLDVVSRYRDPQHQADENFSNLDIKSLISFPMTVIWSAAKRFRKLLWT